MPTANSTISVNSREQRGTQIAAGLSLRKRGDAWGVPSQSGKGQYLVNLDGQQSSCTCPDHTVRRVKCKHNYAVEQTLRREDRPD